MSLVDAPNDRISCSKWPIYLDNANLVSKILGNRFKVNLKLIYV